MTGKENTAREIQAGELEIVKAMEDNTTRNVLAAIEHANETRRIVRTVADQVDTLARQYRQNTDAIADLTRRVSLIQAELYRRKTDGNID